MDKLFSSGEVARMLGIQRDDLNAAIRNQVVAHPKAKAGRFLVWTLAEVDAARRAIVDDGRMKGASNE